MSEPLEHYINEFAKKPHFHKVLALHEQPHSWEEISEFVPSLTRGWYELSQLPKDDRVGFTRDFWFAKLPFFAVDGAGLGERLEGFFSELDDVGIFATQQVAQSPFDIHMLYALKENKGFFHGSPPASRESLATLIRQFSFVAFPIDYLSFFEIHDGFSKYLDTGIIKSKEMARTYQKFQELLNNEILIGADGVGIHPSHLVPFYESTFLHCYQCFFTEWYPKEEMGNLFFSEFDRSISNYSDERKWDDHGAFCSFLGWLLYYLEEL